MKLDRSARAYVAGHKGMVGSALVRKLQSEGFRHILTADFETLDLREQAAVRTWFEQNRPDYVFLAAAKVGGILANSTYPAEFLYDNLAIQTHVIDASYRYGVKRLLFLGSSCIYPRDCPQPIKEEYLLTGPLEKTNEAYAIAKIAGLKMCEFYRGQYGCDFIAAMPTNLYGPNDNYDPETSHVLPALIRKFHEAKVRGDKEVVVWGTGKPRREFLHVDDLADACLFLMEHFLADGQAASELNASEPPFVNVGTGKDLTIRELAEKIRDLVHPAAEIRWDSSKPDGTPRKVLDVSRLLALGWSPKIALSEGLRRESRQFALVRA